MLRRNPPVVSYKHNMWLMQREQWDTDLTRYLGLPLTKCVDVNGVRNAGGFKPRHVVSAKLGMNTGCHGMSYLYIIGYHGIPSDKLTELIGTSEHHHVWWPFSRAIFWGSQPGFVFLSPPSLSVFDIFWPFFVVTIHEHCHLKGCLVFYDMRCSRCAASRKKRRDQLQLWSDLPTPRQMNHPQAPSNGSV